MSEERQKSEPRQIRRRGMRKSIDALITLTAAGFVTIDDISDYISEIERDNNDRSVAILLGTTVENALQSSIERAIRIDERGQKDLFTYDGPLGTFTAKIKMANALRIFGDETRDNLDLIRNIRNTFAHAKVPINFDTRQVKNACALLQIPTSIPIVGMVTMPRLMSLLANPEELKGRLRYEATCHYLSHNFVTWMTNGARSLSSSEITNPPPSNYEVWAIQRPLP
jgi:hypothetical protein